MKTMHRRSILAAAVLAAMGTTAFAQEYTLEELVTPESQVRAGVGFISDDNRWFGMYHGPGDKTEGGVVPLLGLDYVTRDEASGTWTRARLGSGGLGLEYSRQGDWGATLDLSRIAKTNPFVVNTGLEGIGSSRLTIYDAIDSGADDDFDPSTVLRNVDLETERTDFRLGLKKILPAGFDVHLKLRNEEKEGERQWGFYKRGGGSTNREVTFLAEPIDYQTREYEALVGYTGDQLQVTGGVYVTSFDNSDRQVDVTSSIGAYFDQLSLPPDNDSFQFHVNGGYQVSPTTRVTFGASQAKHEQDDDYIAAAVNGRTDLGGEVDTTLLNLGIFSRPMKGLTLSAKARYEDRDDDTPVDLYIPGTTPARDRYNVTMSREFTDVDLEAGYRLPTGLKLKGAYGYEKRERDVPDGYRQATWRRHTSEDIFKLELSQAMSATLNGRLVLQHQARDGSPLISNTSGTDLVAPIHFSDRDRDQVKLNVDWMPMQPLSVQFRAEHTDDDYDGRDLGVSRGKRQFYSVDASYALSDEWKLTGWISRSKQELDQAANDRDTDEWYADLEQVGRAVGVGLRGTPRDDLKVGMDLQYSKDESRHKLSDPDPGDVAPLPDLYYRHWKLRLFADYALDAASEVRLDLIYEKRETDDWAWFEANGDPWAYYDGTTVNPVENEDTAFIGVSYRYRWR